MSSNLTETASIHMNDPFFSPKTLLEEAADRIKSVEKLCDDFYLAPNRKGGCEIDQKTGDYLVFVQIDGGIPNRIGMEVRSTVRDLRDALDHAVFASAASLLSYEPEKTKFPVAISEDEFKKHLYGRGCSDVHSKIKEVILDEKPFKDGNRTLWALNEIRNRNTHRVLTLTNLTSSGLGILDGRIKGRIISISDWRSTRNRLYFCRLPRESEFDMRILPSLAICLQSLFVPEDQPILEFLQNALKEVERIVDRISGETLQISEGGI